MQSTVSTEHLEYGQATDRGLVRRSNEDAMLHFAIPGDSAESSANVFIVADGMGGHRGGRMASAMAVETVRDALVGNGIASIESSGIEEQLRLVFRHINTDILDRGRVSPELLGMGTTLTVLLIRDRQAWIAHVGDSRVYRLTSTGPTPSLEQLTQDDTLVAKLAQQGALSEEEAAHHPKRNLLVQAIGGQGSVDVAIVGPLTVQLGDRFVLCTDGLLEVDQRTIATTVSAFPPQEACDRLVELANAFGGTDNTTVQIVHVVR